MKTANRSHLTDKHTDNLMRIAINGPGLDQSMHLINKVESSSRNAAIVGNDWFVNMFVHALVFVVVVHVFVRSGS